MRTKKKNTKRLCVLLMIVLFISVLGYFLFKQFDNGQKKYRILACMSSYNRPMFASAQVLRLLKQSYPVDISVSIKGVPKNFVDEALLKEWAPEIAKGRVRVRVDENRDQYGNLLDTVRDIDLEQYDFFCKIDDDDWYGPDYFKNLNEWLNREKDIIMTHTRNNMIVMPGENGVSVMKNTSNLSGPSMCFSRYMIKIALELETNLEKARQLVPEADLGMYKYKHEDNFLHRLATALGKVQRRDTPLWDLVFGWQYKSVIRPNA